MLKELQRRKADTLADLKSAREQVPIFVEDVQKCKNAVEKAELEAGECKSAVPWLCFSPSFTFQSCKCEAHFDKCD